MNVIKLKDIKANPDKFYLYTDNIKNSETPIIIDNGSYQCRVGWQTSEQPLLIFRNLIAKARKDRNKKDLLAETLIEPPTLIGNDIVNIEAMRFQLKTQFDRNVVTHFYNQEQIFDYIFSHLNINTDGHVPHPIVMTECLANPNYCRNLMSELLFECYDIPSVCYGIDALYSFKENQFGNDGLIISFGYHTTEVIPVLNNQMIMTKARRLNLGGFHMINFLYRLMQLKYPVHVNAITISRIEELLHDHCSIVTDYNEFMKLWSSYDYYEKYVKIIQLPYLQPVVSNVNNEQKTEKKKELARRLADMAAKKREERLIENQAQFDQMLDIKNLHERGKEREFQKAIKENDIADKEELDRMMQDVKTKIEKIKQRIAIASMEPNEEEVKEKPIIAPKQPANIAIEDWVVDCKQKRNEIYERKQVRKQRRNDLAKRRTAAAQERMRIISQLAQKESKGTDDFGMRDEDWDVYKTISKENDDSDSEAENEKLIEIQEILKHYDPTFEEQTVITADAAENHQLHVGLEAIRAPELLFQPSMIGSCESGLAELIDYVFKLFTSQEKDILAKNVFLTGGCSQFPGLKERLEKELQAMLPFKTKFNVNFAKNSMLDSWYGCRNFTGTDEYEKSYITKMEYLENGGEYLREHSCSNKYYQTPMPMEVIEKTQN